MKTIHQSNKILIESPIGGTLGCLLMLMAMYFIMLGPEQTVLSIHTICTHIKALSSLDQTIILCLLPIYFSIMIFGSGFIGWILGTKAHRLFFRKIV